MAQRSTKAASENPPTRPAESDLTDAQLTEAVHKATGLGDLHEGESQTALIPAGPPIQMPDPDCTPKSPARWAYERLVQYIRNFESNLDADEEVAMGFAGSDAGVLRIEGLGYYDPDILTYYGRDSDGMKTQLVQHVSQMSMLLRAVPKTAPEVPARRIGFHLPPGWTGGEAGDGSV